MHTTITTMTATLALTTACTAACTAGPPPYDSAAHPPPAAARTTDCGRTPSGLHITADLPTQPATACTTARHVADAYHRNRPTPGDDLPNFTVNVDGTTWECRQLERPRPHGRCQHPAGGDVTLT
ncbi:hypothetical protein ABZW11_41255 [Nonomuraea sp. NPDC004580]|uniref:hypothetical protein n=1 Tax=Nonomuraea sp. NPDC004580 TaxID=3154552 RepID=UPI0033ABEA48